jgi:CubicO group peptidase (beta-lactamase class C family)
MRISLQEFEKMPARTAGAGCRLPTGAALAGDIVAEVSGESFEQYIANHIFVPLQMTHSTFLQPLPPNMLQEAATGYDIDRSGVPHARSFEFIQAQPAGALSATANDMAHFMIAHLQDGQFGDAHILQPASAQGMRKRSYAFSPQLPGMTRGFAEAYHNNIHYVFHPGTTDHSRVCWLCCPIRMLASSWPSTPISALSPAWLW